MTDEEWAAQFAQDVLDAERNGWAPPRPEVKDLAENYLKLWELMRWRKFPDEKPDKTGCKHPYTVVADDYPAQAIFASGRWFLDELRSDDDITDKVTHWRPICPIPEATP